MSIEDELDKIKPQKLGSDLPDEFIGEIVSIEKSTKKSGVGAGQPILCFTLMVGEEVVKTNYRIPKALTGKGQYDLLLKHIQDLGYNKIASSLEGKTFKWERRQLTGAIQGNARHYPVEEIKVKHKEIELIGKKK